MMGKTLAKTGTFKSSEGTETRQISHSIEYKLNSTEWISDADAWLFCWNRLRFTTHLGCKLISVDVNGEQEKWGHSFIVNANYEWQPDEVTWATLSFSTRGGREKRMHSYATKRYKAQGALIEPPDFKNAIGYNNGVFDGVDVVVPQFGFSINVDLPSTYFSNAQILYFHWLTGKTNANSFWIFQAEECIFTGMTGNTYRKKNGQNYELWYKLGFEFEAMPSVKGATIPPFQNVDKKGMHYTWVMHQDQKDDASEVTVPLPTALYVEKVYETGDFNWFNMLQW